MKFSTRLIILTLTLLLALSVTAFAKSANQQRAEINELQVQALDNLYALTPNAHEVLENCYGYATISATGSQLGLLGGAHGRGLAVNKATGARVYMKMEAYQLGIGLGGAIEGADIVGKDIWVYQVTTKGLAVGAAIKGLSIYPNRKLNS